MPESVTTAKCRCHNAMPTPHRPFFWGQFRFQFLFLSCSGKERLFSSFFAVPKKNERVETNDPGRNNNNSKRPVMQSSVQYKKNRYMRHE